MKLGNQLPIYEPFDEKVMEEAIRQNRLDIFAKLGQTASDPELIDLSEATTETVTETQTT